MALSESYGINEKGNFTIGGADTVELAKKYGTPFVCYDENGIRENARQFVKSFKDNYNGNGMVCYAQKAFSCLEICRIANQEGLGLDCVSEGEIYTALKAGFPAAKIVFHGNNKTTEELRFAINNNVGRIVADNMEELYEISKTGKSLSKCVNVMLRIKPGVEAHTHEFIKTGQIDSKFGFALSTGEAEEAVALCTKLDYISLTGVHCHIGSQIMDVEPFELAGKIMIDFISDMNLKYNCNIKDLNLGGGFAIKYRESDNPFPFYEYVKRVSESVKAECKKRDMELPFIMIEPGRSLIGTRAITVYTVGSRKEIPEVRTYISVDGGMTDNPRYILYKADYELVCCNKAKEERNDIITLAGRNCESGDLIQENARLQRVERGDLVGVLSTGAYCYSMASNYNRTRRPIVILTDGNSEKVIIKRESLDDIIRNDM